MSAGLISVKYFWNHNYYVVNSCLFQEEQRLRAKQAKEDLEDFLLTTEKINSTIKYR